MRLGTFSSFLWQQYESFCGIFLCFFFAVIEFGIGPEFFPGYGLLSNWGSNNRETIFGRCYCYFQNSWPNYPTREDSEDFVVNDGNKILKFCASNQSTQKCHKTNFFPHNDHILILFDGINEEITIVNRTSDDFIVTTEILPCCYRHEFVFAFSRM